MNKKSTSKKRPVVARKVEPVVLHPKLNDCFVATAKDGKQICDRIRTVADEAFGPFPYMTATEAVDEIEKGICEYKRAVAVALAALERLRDCDWVISLPDRMDAVRVIAADAIAAIHHSSNTSIQRTSTE